MHVPSLPSGVQRKAEMRFMWMQEEAAHQKRDTGKQAREADAFPHRQGPRSTSTDNEVV